MSLPWVNTKPELNASILDASGVKVETTSGFSAGQEYTLVLESEIPMAILMDQNYIFGVEWLDPLPDLLTEQTRHTYRIAKEADSGMKNISSNLKNK